MPVQSPVKPSSKNEEMTLPTESPISALIDKIPIKLVLALAAPYLAGQTPKDAIELAHKIFDAEKYTSTLDLLGEDMDSDSTCDRSVDQYKALVDAITANPLAIDSQRKQLTISLKPSMFSTEAPEDSQLTAQLTACKERIEKVTAYAKENGVNVTLEAEDHRWTSFHLDTYYELIDKGYSNLGTVIQTRLFRTERDIMSFDDRMRVRLVIGIYNEPKEIAHVDKVKMKELLVDYAKELLLRGTYVEVATHDLDCIKNFISNVVIPNKIPSNRFETQFLHGVPRDELQRDLMNGSFVSSLDIKEDKSDTVYLNQLKEEGILVRKYLPYGIANVAGAYCRRRLKENPNMVSYGIKNFFKLK